MAELTMKESVFVKNQNQYFEDFAVLLCLATQKSSLFRLFTFKMFWLFTSFMCKGKYGNGDR